MRKSVPPFTFSALCDLLETSKKKFKKNRKIFFSIFSFLRAFVVSSCRKSGFRVFLSLRYGADLGRSRLVYYKSILKPKVLCSTLCQFFSKMLISYKREHFWFSLIIFFVRPKDVSEVSTF